MDHLNLMRAVHFLASIPSESEFNLTLPEVVEIHNEESIFVIETLVKKQFKLTEFITKFINQYGISQIPEPTVHSIQAVIGNFQNECENADSIEEEQAIFRKYPEMFTELSLTMFQRGLLKYVRIMEYQKSDSVLWAQLIRKHLAFSFYTNDKFFLQKATEKALKWGKNEIAEILQFLDQENYLLEEIAEQTENGNFEVAEEIRNFHDRYRLEINQRSISLSKNLVKLQKIEEAQTLLLIAFIFDVRDSQLPPDGQKSIFDAHDTSIKACHACLLISTALGDKACQAHYKRTLGNSHFLWNNFNEAGKYFQSALHLYHELIEEDVESRDLYEPYLAMSWNDLGSFFAEMRQFDKSEEAFSESLKIRKRLFEKYPEIEDYFADLAMCRLNLGITLRDQRMIDEAKLEFVEALKIFDNLCERPSKWRYENYQVLSLQQLAGIYIYEQNFADAEILFKKALAVINNLDRVSGGVKHNFDRATTLYNLGNLLSKIPNRFDEAVQYFEDALEIYKEIAEYGNIEFNGFIATTLSSLADLLHANGYKDQAKEKLNEAVKLCNEYKSPDMEREVFMVQGNISAKEENWQQAAESFQRSIVCIEKLRGESYSADRARQIISENIRIYEGLIVSLIKLGSKEHIEKAFEISELGKGRSITDLIYQRVGNSEENTNSLLNRYQQAHTLTFEEMKGFAKECKKTFVSFRFTEQETYIFYLFPDGTLELTKIPDFTTKDLSEMTVNFNTDLNGRLVPSGGWLYHYYNYLTAIDKVKIASTNRYDLTDLSNHTLAESELYEAYNEFLESEESWFEEMELKLNLLYEKLFKFVHRQLKCKQAEFAEQNLPQTIKELVIIPNRQLSLFPIHACWWKDKLNSNMDNSFGNNLKYYLIDEFNFTYSPNISIYKDCYKNDHNNSLKSLLVVADPSGDLKSSKIECEEIKKYFQPENVTYFENDKAQKGKVIESVSEKDVIHFSCHGKYSVENPFKSFLFLAENTSEVDLYFQNNLLHLEEIMKLNLIKSSLVVLSACETGISDFSRDDDEFFGLSLGFIIAGASSVWGSLWSVQDDATKELLVNAYENLMEKGLSKSESLRQAQLKLRNGIVTNNNNEILSHPYYWSGMQSFGV